MNGCMNDRRQNIMKRDMKVEDESVKPRKILVGVIVAPGIGNCDIINKENLKLRLKATKCTKFYNEIVIVDVHRTMISTEQFTSVTK